MADVAFCICKLMTAVALKQYLSSLNNRFSSFAWPTAVFLGGGAGIWMAGEIFYAGASTLKKNTGDFGHIAHQGRLHIALAGTAFVSQCALGVFAVMKLADK